MDARDEMVDMRGEASTMREQIREQVAAGHRDDLEDLAFRALKRAEVAVRWGDWDLVAQDTMLAADMARQLIGRKVAT